MPERYGDTDLVVTLATELAIALEHYEDDASKWFPEALEAIDRAADLLKRNGLETPTPIRFVLERRVRPQN